MTIIHRTPNVQQIKGFPESFSLAKTLVKAAGVGKVYNHTGELSKWHLFFRATELAHLFYML